MKIISGRIPEVANFLQQLTDERQIVVRVRGLPYATKKSDIVSSKLWLVRLLRVTALGFKATKMFLLKQIF